MEELKAPTMEEMVMQRKGIMEKNFALCGEIEALEKALDKAQQDIGKEKRTLGDLRARFAIQEVRPKYAEIELGKSIGRLNAIQSEIEAIKGGA